MAKFRKTGEKRYLAMEHTGFGEQAVVATESPSMVDSGTPLPKTVKKNTIKTDRVKRGRPKKAQQQLSQSEALRILASAIEYVIESGIKVIQKPYQDAIAIVLKDVAMVSVDGDVMTFMPISTPDSGDGTSVPLQTT